MIIIGYSAYNQPKLQTHTTIVRGGIGWRDPYLDIFLHIGNNKDIDTTYTWAINIFYRDKEMRHSYSDVAKGGRSIDHIKSIIVPHEKENLRIGIEVYEEGVLIDKRIYYLNATELPIAW